MSGPHLFLGLGKAFCLFILLWFVCLWSWGLNSGPHTCWASVLPLESLTAQDLLLLVCFSALSTSFPSSCDHRHDHHDQQLESEFVLAFSFCSGTTTLQNGKITFQGPSLNTFCQDGLGFVAITSSLPKSPCFNPTQAYF
jgi:hypothetical protein